MTFSADGQYSVSFRSVDHAGNVEEAKTAGFKIDRTAPQIAVSVPQAVYYGDEQELLPHVQVTDTGSGPDTGQTSMTLDGATLQSGAGVPLYTLPLGAHEFTVGAEDLAGNRASTTVSFVTTTSMMSLEALVSLFSDQGWIDNKGIANSLEQKLKAGALDAFENEVEAQTGKHITNEAASYFMRDAEALLSPIPVSS